LAEQPAIGPDVAVTAKGSLRPLARYPRQAARLSRGYTMKASDQELVGGSNRALTPRKRAMSIIPRLAQSAFEPEMIETLVSAFENAWRKVELSGSKFASPAYKRAAQEILAKRIIEMAQRGERDPGELVDDAVAYLDRSYA
jgi:hypothetical protein